MFRRLAIASILFALASACSGGGGSAPPPVPGELFEGYAPNTIELVLLEPLAPLTPQTPSAGITGYSIAPPLPAGLVLDAASGSISGAAEQIAPLTEYLITASNGSEVDSESLILRVRAPVVTLESDTPLVRAETSTASSIAPTTFLLSAAPAPLAQDLAVTTIDAPLAAAGTLVPISRTPNAPIAATSVLHDATVNFVANLTFDSSELVSQPWSLALAPPYATSTAALDLSGFALDTQDVDLVDGALTVELSLTSPPIAPFETESLPTSVLTSQLVSDGLATITGTSLSSGPFVYFVASQDVIHPDLDRYSDAGPALQRLTDVEAAGGFFTTLGAALDDWIVLESDLGAGLEKPLLFDAANGTLAQMSDLNGTGSDIASDFVRLSGAVYFSAGPTFSERHVYRFTPAAGALPSRLDRVSFTATDDQDDPQALTPLNGALFFTALHAGTGERHLFRFDPVTEEQERLSTSAQANVSDLREVSGELFAIARGPGGQAKLHRFDPTSNGLAQLADLTGDPMTSDVIAFLDGSDSRLLFEARAPSGGRKLFVYDPASGTLDQASNTAGNGAADSILEVIDLGDELLFAARNAQNSSKLYATNLLTGEHWQVTDENGPSSDDSPCDFVLRSSGEVAFAMDLDATGGFALVQLEAGDARPIVTADPLGPMNQDDVTPLLEHGGRLLFRAGPNTQHRLYAAE